MEDIVLSARNITHYYTSSNGKKTLAVNNVSIDIKRHEFVALIGPSGCGKSTLLNIMAGMIKNTNGEVLVEGEVLKGINPKIGYISQMDTLLPWKNVVENIAFGLEIKGVKKEDRLSIAKDLMKKIGLEGFENSYPHEISGGMKKRVTIARAIAIDPEVIFMDEPFGPLDVFTKEVLQDEILKIWKETKKTIVYITHDLAEAITLSDRVILMSNRPCKVKKEYIIDIDRPRNVREIRFNNRFIELEKKIWNDLKGEVEESKKIKHENNLKEEKNAKEII